MNRRTAAFALALAAVLSSSSAAAERENGLLWWNDPQIAQELALRPEQRQKMDAAYEVFRETLGPLRTAQQQRSEYLDALQRGDWEVAKEAAAKWIDAEEAPRRGMADLKLTVLPMLSDVQRERLFAKYPRLLRRSWNPSPRWGLPEREPRPRPGRPDPKRDAPKSAD